MSSPPHITASILYALTQCPHRVTRDWFDDPAGRDPVSRFAQLLWERGTLFETEVVGNLNLDFTDLRKLAGEERESATRDAIKRRDPLIYQARLTDEDLLGEPDLLRLEGDDYVAIDIKSGSGFEASSDLTDGKPKKHYAVQLALYTDLLERHGVSAGRAPRVWDVHGREITYALDTPQGPRTPESWWDLYQRMLADARRIRDRETMTDPAHRSICKQCHWRSSCRDSLDARDDLTLIPDLGPKNRQALQPYVTSVQELADTTLDTLAPNGKSLVKGSRIDSLRKFILRAQLLKSPRAIPFSRSPFQLPHHETELFFDIETDALRDHSYLHGFVERIGGPGATERYVSFLSGAPTPDEECRVFQEAWNYVQAKLPCALYFYGQFEITWWKKLQQRYPHVASEREIAELFSSPNVVNLYEGIVKRHTEWPTNDHSLKTLARYLGFEWQDESPSGADSIEWYHRWIGDGDSTLRDRILAYNKDDCVATRVLVDALRDLPIRA